MGGPPSEAVVDDRTLLARHVAGDRDAFGELVARHRDRLWAVAYRTLGDRDDAADALQDALLSAYRAAAGYRGDAAPTTWLHRIVVNACLDQRRRRAARPTVPLSRDVADAVADPTDAVDARATSLTVVAALRSLPPEQAAALVLVDVEGMSVAEAAEVLDVAEGTVKSRCARGRGRLAVLLRGATPDTGNLDRAAPVQPTTGVPTDTEQEDRA